MIRMENIDHKDSERLCVKSRVTFDKAKTIIILTKDAKWRRGFGKIAFVPRVCNAVLIRTYAISVKAQYNETQYETSHLVINFSVIWQKLNALKRILLLFSGVPNF